MIYGVSFPSPTKAGPIPACSIRPMSSPIGINVDGINILNVEADFVFEEVFREASALRFLGVCRNSLNHVDLESATKPWCGSREHTGQECPSCR